MVTYFATRAMEMNDPHTAEESKPLLALLERYAYFRTEAMGKQVLHELMNGPAVLYLLVNRTDGSPAFMLGEDGKPLTAWLASTTVDRDLIGATDHEEEVTFQPRPVSEIMRLMQKKGDKLPFMILMLNNQLDSAAWLIRQNRTWRMMAPPPPEVHAE
ncbi:MAG: hypothetical protein IPP83_11390 [Flavobacteriales bacterium]|nr:hypothetical protein [Flavobacteriales bacterium]